MKKIVLTAAVLLFLIPGVLLASEDAELKSQTTCPVMGGKIDKDVYVDYQGQRVYFCCPGCIDTFKENPEKYFKKIQEEGVLLESIQEKCPVMGGDIDKEVFTDYKGRRVYFCCSGCIDKFKAEPEKYLDKIK